ncbi:MAG: enoyl-CoA hydratase/isomerase family protein [Gammaproteobacteria bacterium]|nr:enoyl-CoA hydratase/isomerase family protein [Gammaproteobacteria bacterium]MYD75219.1 enoyl-CoA hydratase/isomerase family protein [Gammaproteobacteria bacterium]MYJ51600.1 enoyl-CoA hydratase/isomerase family protein [Gammaproteobacteria bacterium]
MNYQHLTCHIEEKICTITLNRPEVLNAVNRKLCSEIAEALHAADRNPDVNVVVMNGAGRAFCSGHDLKGDAEEPREIYGYYEHYKAEFEEFTAIWKINTPVIVSAHGYCIGKGFEFAMMADVSILSEEVTLGLGEMRYGIPAITLTLPWKTGMNSAKEMVLTGLDVSAREAKERGLITMVCKRDELEALTQKVARRMALMPRDMQRMHKSYMNRVYETMGFWKANKDYLEILAILGTQVVPEYARFSETTIKRGLKAALQEANAPFDELERSFASDQDPA